MRVNDKKEERAEWIAELVILIGKERLGKGISLEDALGVLKRHPENDQIK